MQFLGITYRSGINGTCLYIFAEQYPASLFKKTVLIFDNACKLLQYIQNRDPDLFVGEELQSCFKSSYFGFINPTKPVLVVFASRYI